MNTFHSHSSAPSGSMAETNPNPKAIFQDVLRGRRSVKSYDPSVKIDREEMSEILSEAGLAPSSFNLQPWRFVVIESPEAKETLLKLAPFNASQVTTSSAVVAIFGDLRFETRAEEIYGRAVEQGHMPQELKERQLGMMLPMLGGMPMQAKRESVMLDGGLAAMQLMLAAHARGYDTNPMGGFDKANIAASFGLDPERYAPVLIVSIGKAAAEGQASVRFSVEEITDWK